MNISKHSNTIFSLILFSVILFMTGCGKESAGIDRSNPELLSQHITEIFITADTQKLADYLQPSEMNSLISQEMVNRYSPEFSSLNVADFTFELSDKEAFGNRIVYVKHKDQGNQHYEFKFSLLKDVYYFVDLSLMYDIR